MGGVGRINEKAKGLRSINLVLQNTHGDVKYSLVNKVNKTLITMCGVR